MLKQRTPSVIALIPALFAAVVVLLVGCGQAPTVTPVPAWPTLMPSVAVAVVEPSATQRAIVVPTALPTHRPQERAYPLPVAPTSTPYSYPSPGVAGSGDIVAQTATQTATQFASPPTVTVSATSAEPMHSPTRGSIRGRAKVDEVQINIIESLPVQVSLVVHGFLPDGCTQLVSIEQSRSPEGLVFDAITDKDPEAVCTQALVPFEEVVSVDLQGLRAGSYVIDVNGITTTLKLDSSMLVAPEPISQVCPEPSEGTLRYRSAGYNYCFLYAADMQVTSLQCQGQLNSPQNGQLGIPQHKRSMSRLGLLSR